MSENLNKINIQVEQVDESNEAYIIHRDNLIERFPFDILVEQHKGMYGICEKFMTYEDYIKLIKKRYYVYINFLSYVHLIKEKYVDTGLLNVKPLGDDNGIWIKRGIEDILVQEDSNNGFKSIFEIGYKQQQTGMYKAAVPFTIDFLDGDYSNIYDNLELVFDIQPDAIFVVPKSAIFPSIILKSIITHATENGLCTNFNPSFCILPNKNFKDGVLKLFEKGELNSESQNEVKENINYFKDKVLNLFKQGQNKIVIFDEYIERGWASGGIKSMLLYVQELLKKEGLIPFEYNLEIRIITFGDSMTYNAPGKGYITNDNFGVKGGSKIQHWVARKIFHKLGDTLSEDYFILKNIIKQLKSEE